MTVFQRTLAGALTAVLALCTAAGSAHPPTPEPATPHVLLHAAQTGTLIFSLLLNAVLYIKLTRRGPRRRA